MKTPQAVHNVLWVLFALAAIAIGFYPFAFASAGFRNNGLLSSKSYELRTNPLYLTAFYIHISCGGLALLTGWSQFIKSWRNKHLMFHRYLGYAYVISVLISSITGFIIALYSSGGVVASVGFGMLAILWLLTDLYAFLTIKQRKFKEHEQWMMRNYALTFAAVTLRIYLGILIRPLAIELTLQIVSWLCWVPNIVIVEAYIRLKMGEVINSPEVLSPPMEVCTPARMEDN